MSRASDRAFEAIRSMILSGELPAGAQVVEEALAEKCGVSRTPVRDALRRLIQTQLDDVPAPLTNAEAIGLTQRLRDI